MNTALLTTVLLSIVVGGQQAGDSRKSDRERLSGKWRPVDAEPNDGESLLIVFKEKRAGDSPPGESKHGIVIHIIDESKRPKEMVASVFTVGGVGSFHGIYSLEKGVLKICYNKNPAKDEPKLPKEFAEIPDRRVLLVLKRVP